MEEHLPQSDHTIHRRPDSFVVVDFEATCCDDNSLPPEEREIIEFGVVRVNGSTLEPIDEFQAFVRPELHSSLTPFCTELTSITQEQVDASDPFPAVLAEFTEWLGDGDQLFVSWGSFDRKQLLMECRRHGVHYPFDRRHLNLKSAFARHLARGRRVGMKQAMRRLSLPLEGCHHRGIDDARNIARMIPPILNAMPQMHSKKA